MRFEVELVEGDDGLFHAAAVPFPDVKATGRTEKEALGLLIAAIEKYMKEQARQSGERG